MSQECGKERQDVFSSLCICGAFRSCDTLLTGISPPPFWRHLVPVWTLRDLRVCSMLIFFCLPFQKGHWYSGVTGSLTVRVCVCGADVSECVPCARSCSGRQIHPGTAIHSSATTKGRFLHSLVRQMTLFTSQPCANRDSHCETAASAHCRSCFKSKIFKFYSSCFPA